jgi:RNA polymerase sigma-70 factor (ECF subfamily)
LRKALSAVLDEDPGATGGCPELAEAIAAYSASEIDQATCSSIEAHLTACPSCAGACDSLKRTVSLCRQIPGGQVPAPIRAAVRRALAQITRG